MCRGQGMVVGVIDVVIITILKTIITIWNNKCNKIDFSVYDYCPRSIPERRVDVSGANYGHAGHKRLGQPAPGAGA